MPPTRLLEELARLTSEEPDELTFRAVCSAIDSRKRGRNLPRAFQFVNSKMRYWPDKIRHVECVPEQLSELVESLSWPLVRSVRIHDSPTVLVVPTILNACENLTHVQVNVDGEEIAKGLDFTVFPYLRHLTLSIGPAITDSDLRSFMNDRFPVGLESFAVTVTRDEHWDAVYSYLADTARANLKSLRVVSPRQGFLRDAVRHLPRSLRHLSYRVASIDKPELNASLRSSIFQRLRSLDFSYCGIDDDGISVIAKSRALKNLAKLNLAGNDCSATGANALTKSSLIEQLDELSLAANPLQGEGCGVILAGPTSSMRTLFLKDTMCNDEALFSFARQSQLGQLRVLDLAGNQLTDKGASILVKSPRASQLTMLRLDYNQCTSRTLSAIADSSIRLVELGISQFGINDDGFVRFIQSSAARRLRKAYFAHCSLGPEELKSITRSDCLPNLRLLDLRWTNIGDEGLIKLANSRCMRQLWVFLLTEIMSNRKFQDLGIRSLATSTQFNQLVDLTLIGLNVSDEAMRELAMSKALRRLDRIELEKQYYRFFTHSDSLQPATQALVRHCRKHGCPF